MTFHGSRKRRGLLWGLCILAMPACSVEPGSNASGAEVVERLRAHPLHLVEGKAARGVLPPSGVARVERVEGGFTAVPGPRSPTSTGRPAQVVLPEVAQHPFRLRDSTSGMTLEVALAGAAPVRGEVVDGYVVYAGAHPEGGDVVHRLTPEGTEDYVAFARAPASPEVRYELRLGEAVAGLRLVANSLEVLDEGGAPRLRMAPPYVVDAEGRVIPAGLSVEGCAVDESPVAPWGRRVTAPGARQCRVRVAWREREMKYPAVLDPSWVTTGSLAIARTEPSAVVLQDGRVLALGGMGAPGYLASAELYDPATGTWAAASSLAHPRRLHTTTRLDSGKVLVVGGYGDTASPTTAELYDPSNGLWYSTATMLQERKEHAASLLSDGRVLVSGGYNSEGVASAHLYNPVTDTWSYTGSLVNKRYGHTSQLLADGKVLVAQGWDSGALKTAELYDPATGTWTLTGSSSTWRSNQSSTLLADGRVLMTAGAYVETEVYDPATGAWSLSGPLNVARRYASASTLGDGRVLVVGGTGNTAGLQQAELYDPATGAWSFSATLNTHRSSHAAVVLGDGRVLVVGGTGPAPDYPRLASAELFTHQTNDTVAPTASLTAPTEGATLEGSVTVSASASDDLGVVRVEFYDGSTLIGTDTSAPYSVAWNTRTAANGGHTLVARAFDSAGNTGSSAAVNVTLNNDLTPPTTSLTEPAAGATVQGTVTVSASASDDRGVARVEFYDGSALIGTDTTAPYAVSWATLGAVNGGHTLTSKAYDAAGNVGSSAGVTVTVNNPGAATYDSTLRAPACRTVGAVCDSGKLLDGRANLGPESNAPNTLQGSCADGTGGTYHVDESMDRLRLSTTDGSAFASGKTVRIEATVWAYSGYSSDSLDLYTAADANSPTWTYLTTLSPTQAGANTLSTTFTLPGGALQAVRARFRYGGSASACTTGSYDDHDDLVFAVDSASDVTAPTVSLTEPVAGATVSGTTTLSASASDDMGVARVEFFLGTTLLATDTTAPYAVTWDTKSHANGSYTLQARAYDAAGNVGQSAQVGVTVSNSTAATATYDSTLGAPRCGSAATSCDAGGLLNGRATLGPEANYPNTVDTCTDATSGSYHVDESLDRLKVSTTDGTELAAGKTVRIDATVWAYSSYTSDYLDLYYASDASAPSWTFLGTLQATQAGAHVLSTTYTLPAATSRAVVRGVFRWGGSAGTCPGGSFTDVDDLVFYVR